nr:reverse transcriptase domain-containing protein [Tanacetum cinerariifolium]
TSCRRRRFTSSRPLNDRGVVTTDLNGRGGPTAPIAIQATNFGLKNIQNSCQFHGLPGDDANKHLDKIFHVTQSIKVNGVTNDALRLYLFPHSLTHHATTWFDRLPRNSINTFEQMAKMFLGKYFLPSMPPLAKLRTYKLREPIIKVVILTNLKGNNHGRNQFFQGAGHVQNSPPAYQAPAYQASGYQAPVQQAPIPQPQVVTTTEFTNYMMANDAFLKNMQTNMTSLINSNLELKNMFGQFMKMSSASSSGMGTLLSNTITNPKEDLKVSPPEVVTKDTMPRTNNGVTKDVQPLVVQVETQEPNFEPVVAPVVEPVEAPSFGGVFTARKPLIFLRLATMDPPGDIMARTTSPKREKSYNVMKCLKMSSKFTRSLTYRVSISWGRSRLHEEASIYSWRLTTCRNSDRSTHFCNDQFAKVMLKYGVTHRLAIAYNPQMSRHVEVSNSGLKRILKSTVGENRASSLNKLDDALWAFRTTFKTFIGCTLYKLVYEKAFCLSIELEH